MTKTVRNFFKKIELSDGQSIERLSFGFFKINDQLTNESTFYGPNGEYLTKAPTNTKHRIHYRFLELENDNNIYTLSGNTFLKTEKLVGVEGKDIHRTKIVDFYDCYVVGIKGTKVNNEFALLDDIFKISLYDDGIFITKEGKIITNQKTISKAMLGDEKLRMYTIPLSEHFLFCHKQGRQNGGMIVNSKMEIILDKAEELSSSCYKKIKNSKYLIYVGKNDPSNNKVKTKDAFIFNIADGTFTKLLLNKDDNLKYVNEKYFLWKSPDGDKIIDQHGSTLLGPYEQITIDGDTLRLSRLEIRKRFEGSLRIKNGNMLYSLPIEKLDFNESNIVDITDGIKSIDGELVKNFDILSGGEKIGIENTNTLTIEGKKFKKNLIKKTF